MAKRGNKQPVANKESKRDIQMPEINISEYLQAEKKDIMLNGEVLKETALRDENVLSMFSRATDIDSKERDFFDGKDSKWGNLKDEQDVEVEEAKGGKSIPSEKKEVGEKSVHVDAEKQEPVLSREGRPDRDEQIKDDKDIRSLEMERDIEKDFGVYEKGQDEKDFTELKDKVKSESQMKQGQNKDILQEKEHERIDRNIPEKEPSSREQHHIQKERFPSHDVAENKDVSNGKNLEHAKDIVKNTNREVSEFHTQKPKSVLQHNEKQRDDSRDQKLPPVQEKDNGLNVGRMTPQGDPSKTQYVYSQGGETYIVEVTQDSDPDMAYDAVEDRAEEKEALEEKEIEVVIEQEDGRQEIHRIADRQRELELEQASALILEDERRIAQEQRQLEEAELEEERRFEEMSVEDKGLSLTDIIQAATVASVATAVVAPELGGLTKGKDTLWEGLEELSSGRDIRSM